MRKIIFGQPVLGEEEINEVVDTIRSGWIGTGPKCQRFENDFAEYVGARHAISLSSCTAALHLSLVVSGIKRGDEVITTPLTFAATVNSIWHVGAKPILVDIDSKNFNIDVEKIEGAITPRTKAIIPVHYGGLPCDMGRINDIAKRNNLVVIEDAAHAVGGEYEGKKIGSLGNLTCFSFYANKNITTVEGGMLTTDDDRLAEELRSWRLHGLSGDAWKRFHSDNLILAEVIYPGYKYNMTDIQASFGIWQLKKISQFLETREKYAKLYDEYFSSFDGVRLQDRAVLNCASRHALHLYVVVIDPNKAKKTRNEIVAALRARGIGAAIHYDVVHFHKFYRENLGYVVGDFPVSEEVGTNVISLPLTPAMSEEDIKYVAEEVIKEIQSE